MGDLSFQMGKNAQRVEDLDAKVADIQKDVKTIIFGNKKFTFDR